MATTPRPPEAADEDSRGEDAVTEQGRDDRPELLIKLEERKRRHAERGIVARVLVVVGGVLLVLAGIVLSGPGIPGPGFLLILLGLSFLALEFDRAERLLGRAIVAADKAKARADNASPRQKALTAAVTVLLLGAFVAAAILYDIPLLPV
ncbi:MAG TPA: PGPGW domain-containing protein [Thermoleophilaceae bacterium]|nr:PGPGW domain-containing protein [Thermoleophilaceae bacterium]